MNRAELIAHFNELVLRDNPTADERLEMLDLINEQQAEIEKMRDALEFYANDDNRGLKQMGTFNGGVVMCDEYVHDNGKRAKEALAAFEKGV